MIKLSPSNLTRSALAGGAFFTLSVLSAMAHDHSEVEIIEQNGQRCILSNGLPDHSTGTFPNRGNPHSIKEQHIRLCVSAHPKKSNRARYIRGSIGVALNGVQFRPGTADYYDPDSRRGFSRDRSSGWNLEGMGARELLGLDENNAHVDERGLYHYHGVASALSRLDHSSLIGYAADGFEIHYVGSGVSSSWRLKSGTRPSGPGGRYDGTYNEDWEFVAGSGSLDECNGGTLNGTFVYFATDTYPFYPRCLWGQASADFTVENRGNAGQNTGFSPRNDQPGNGRRQGSRHGPPPQAIAACSGRSTGAQCRFEGRGSRQIQGQCAQTPERVTACVPNGGAPRG